jgi:hypothetical protein
LFYEEALGKGAGTFAFLAGLVNGGEAAEENGWRDYKAAGFIGKMSNPDEERQKVRKVWSEYLSAFGNTGGGVLLWGFHTIGKMPDRLDLASDCEELAGWLRMWVNDATDPHVAGVEVTAVKDPGDAKAGMVICFIPASTFAPHQAQWGERTYFIRTQDSNVVCPQPLLRNLFFPRLQSRLQATVKMTAYKRPDGTVKVVMEARIGNLGPGTAEVAMISFEPLDISAEPGHCDAGWQLVGTNLVTPRYPLPPNFVAPPLIAVQGTPSSSGASVKFSFFAHNTPAHEAIVRFSQEEIMECLNRQTHLERRVRGEPCFE